MNAIIFFVEKITNIFSVKFCALWIHQKMSLHDYAVAHVRCASVKRHGSHGSESLHASSSPKNSPVNIYSENLVKPLDYRRK